MMIKRLLRAVVLLLCLLAPVPAISDEIEIDRQKPTDLNVDTLHWTLRILGDCITRYPDFVRMVTNEGKKYMVIETRKGNDEPVYQRQSCEDAMDWYKVFREELIGNYEPQAAGGIFACITIDKGKLKSVTFFKRPIDPKPDGVTVKVTTPYETRKPSEQQVKASITAAINKTLAQPDLPFPAAVSEIEVLIGIGDTSTTWWQTDNFFKASFHKARKHEKEEPSKSPAKPPPIERRYPTDDQQIEEAKATLEATKKDPEADCWRNLTSRISLANTFRRAHKTVEADKEFLEAIDYYKTKSAQIPLGADQMWSYLARHTEPDQFDKYYAELLNVAEDAIKEKLSDRGNKLSDLNRVIYHTTGERKSKSSSFDLLDALNKAIEIRQSKRGKQHPSLYGLLTTYSAHCELAGNIRDAEQTLLRANALIKPDAAVGSAFSNLSLAEFYLRHKIWDKAKVNWLQAERSAANKMTERLADSLATLLSSYIKSSNDNQMYEYADSLLALGGDDLLVAIDSPLNEIVNGLIRSGDLTRAEHIMRKRVEASAKMARDGEIDNWRMKLSEVYLQMERWSESEVVFAELVKSQKPQASVAPFVFRRRIDMLRAAGRVEDADKLAKLIEVPTSSAIQIKFSLLGLKEISFGHNTMFEEVDSQDQEETVRRSGSGKQISICSLGTIYGDANLSFGGTAYGTVEPEYARMQLKDAGAEIRAIPADLAKALIAPFEAPKTAVKIEPNDRARIFDLGPGDYIVESSKVDLSIFDGKSPVRLFLTDDNSNGSEIELKRGGFFGSRPANLQIFYKGTRRLSLDGVCAIVYAPNATIELPFNSRFTGAIVANRIIGRGNNKYTFDVQLLNLKLTSTALNQVKTDPGDRTQLQLEIIESAAKARSAVWTRSIPGQAALLAYIQRYRHELEVFAQTHDIIPSQNQSWVDAAWTRFKSDPKSQTRNMEEAVRIRELLVNFAGEQSVKAVEKSMSEHPPPLSDFSIFLMAASKRNQTPWTIRISNEQCLRSFLNDYRAGLCSLAKQASYGALRRRGQTSVPQLMDYSDQWSLSRDTGRLRSLRKALIDFSNQDVVLSFESNLLAGFEGPPEDTPSTFQGIGDFGPYPSLDYLKKFTPKVPGKEDLCNPWYVP